MRLTCFLLVAWGCGLCWGFNNRGFSASFSIDSQLKCGQRDKFGKEIEETRFRVSFVPTSNDSVWLPLSSGFQLPALRERADKDKLLLFLAAAPDFQDNVNFVGTDDTRPIEDPPPPSRGLSLPGMVPFPTRAPPEIIFDEAADIDEIDTVTSYIRARRLGQCDLVSEWTRLPEDYFPFWFAGTKCVNSNQEQSCSFPAGLSCEPDVRPPSKAAYITVLRWDCCNTVFRYECGWRRVEIPIVVDCVCGCKANV